MCEIVELPKIPCGVGNTPGVVKAWVIEKENIELGAAVNSVVASFDLALGADFKEITGTIPRQANGISNYTFNEDVGSDFVTNNFAIIQTKMSGATSNALESLRQVPILVFLQDANGKIHIYGDDSDMFMKTAEGGTGLNKPDERNGYAITFTQEVSGHFPYEYSGIPADFEPGG